MTPNRFREELKRFDKTLDIEYNGAKMIWEIVGYDRKNVRYVIKKIPLGQMTTLGVATLKELYDCSPLKQGGAKNLNQRIDDLIEAEERAEERALQDRIDEQLQDAWLHLQHKNGYRVSFYNPSGEQKEFVVTDKRRVSPDTGGTTMEVTK